MGLSSGLSANTVGFVCSQPMRCGQGALLRCREACAALLNCGEHTCLQVCHDGACQPCQVQVQQGESESAELTENKVFVFVPFCYYLLIFSACFCGVTHREALCGTDKEGFDGSGHFSCGKQCGM